MLKNKTREEKDKIINDQIKKSKKITSRNDEIIKKLDKHLELLSKINIEQIHNHLYLKHQLPLKNRIIAPKVSQTSRETQTNNKKK